MFELCYGIGRPTVPTARDGYSVCGVDHTPSTLEQAKMEAIKAKLVVDSMEADIRIFDLQEKFGLIFIPLNSARHLYRNEDLLNTLECARNHLKTEGLFPLDCSNPNIQYVVESGKVQVMVAKYTMDDGRDVLIKQTARYENTTQVNRIEWYYLINGESHSIQNLDMRMSFPQELDSYLERTGFDIIYRLGSFEEGAFNDNSEKQIYVLALNGSKVLYEKI